MRRRLLDLLTGLSLLLCVVLGVLWARSYWACDYWFRGDERAPDDASVWAAASGPGALWLCHERYDARMRQRSGPALSGGLRSEERPPDVLLMTDPTFPGNEGFRHLWFAWKSEDGRYGAQLLIIPDWCLVVVAALLPAVRFFGWSIRRHRRKAGRCPPLRVRPARERHRRVSGVRGDCGSIWLGRMKRRLLNALIALSPLPCGRPTLRPHAADSEECGQVGRPENARDRRRDDEVPR